MQAQPSAGITKQTLKQRALLFLFFFLLLIVLTISAEFLNSFPPFIVFAGFLITLLMPNISDTLYVLYFKRMSSLPSEKVAGELRWMFALRLLSIISILAVALFMNIPLANYQTQANQLILIVGVIFIFKEFIQIIATQRTFKRLARGESIQGQDSTLGIMISLILTVTISFLALAKIALTFPPTNRYLSLALLLLITVASGHYMYKKFVRV
jgi:hypothetical protein